jgi:hypothetical protein
MILEAWEEGAESGVAPELMALCDRSGMYLKGITLCGFTPEMREIWTAANQPG